MQTRGKAQLLQEWERKLAMRWLKKGLLKPDSKSRHKQLGSVAYRFRDR